MDRSGIFAGDDPFVIARRWLAEAEKTEPNDPNAIALATADADGLPNVRMVLLKEIEAAGFVFYTNYGSAKGGEIDATGKAAFVMHWKSLRRQVRVRGLTERVEGPQAWKVSAEEVKARGYNLDIKNPHTVAADHGDPETLLADLGAAEAQVTTLRDQLKAILTEALAR